MTQQDYQGFSLEFRRLSAALGGYKQTPGEVEQKIDTYFHVLKAFSLAEVQAKADVWLRTQTKMPKPAEWAAVVARKAVEVPTMSEPEAREWRKAEQSRWQGEPCGCQSCREADITEKPIRFVPDERQEREPVSGRVVMAGHWAHGWELFRWYQAKADFYNRCLELGLKGDRVLQRKPKQSFEARLESIFTKVAEVVK